MVQQIDVVSDSGNVTVIRWAARKYRSGSGCGETDNHYEFAYRHINNDEIEI